jgi:hypothetical protein
MFVRFDARVFVVQEDVPVARLCRRLRRPFSKLGIFVVPVLFVLVERLGKKVPRSTAGQGVR